MERQLVIGGFYRHFKNKLYQVRAIAYHSETKEKMVVYQALYGDYSVYVRPYDMFMSEVDRQKYPDIYQKYRFEQVYPDGSDMPHVAADNTSDINAYEDGNIEQDKMHSNSDTHNSDIIKTDTNIDYNTSISHDSAYNDNRCQYDNVSGQDYCKDNEDTDEQVNPLLMEFLDAEDYQQKLNTLTGMRSKLDDKLIDAMAASMEIEVPEGPIDKRYASLRSCIMTHAKFECTRLRN